MHLFSIFVYLIYLVELSYQQPGPWPPDQLTPISAPMIQYADSSSYFSFVDMGRNGLTVDYQRLMVAANAAFNFLKEQPYVTTSGSRIALVACVGITGQTRAYCSSVPRGEMYWNFAELLNAPQSPASDAPRWERAFRVNNHGSWAHAEDAAYYLYESDETTDLTQTPGNMYPEGAAVAVWASAEPGARGYGVGRVPCDGGDGKFPTCRMVADNLGVIHGVADPWRFLVNPQGPPIPDPFEQRQGPVQRRQGPFHGPRNFTSKRGSPEVTFKFVRDWIGLPAGVVQDILRLESYQQIPAHLPPIPSLSPSQSTTTSTQTPQGTTGTSITTAPTSTVIPTPTLGCNYSEAFRLGLPVPENCAHGLPNCQYYPMDPDQGVGEAYCSCDGAQYATRSLDPTAATSDLCAYTVLPTATSISSGFGPATTDMAHCQVCSKASNNEDNCSKIPNCEINTAQATVTAATTPVHVGTLTGEALYTSVSSALEELCPPVTQTKNATKCSGKAIIPNIAYIDEGDDGLAQDGEIVVSVPLSSYNVTSLRDAMISSLATSIQSSATNKNCYSESYSLQKRHVPPALSLFARGQPNSYGSEPVTFCNAAQEAQVNYYSQYWRDAPGATDTMTVLLQFHEDSAGDFLCEFLDLLAGALTFVVPEFAVEEGGLDEAIALLCGEIDT